MRHDLLLYVNGRERRVRGEDSFLTLSTWLRQSQHFIGTKVVCEEGDCGACTVLIGRVEDGQLRYLPVNSCIQLMAQLDLTHVVTVEGLAPAGQLSPVQECMVDHHGAQCGYCTPGFVVAITGLAEEKKQWQPCDVREALTGNLCRCTGYSSIIESAMAASQAAGPTMSELYESAPIVAAFDANHTGTAVESSARRFFAPATLDEALRIKSEHPDLLILQGGTDLGVLNNKRAFAPAVLMSLGHIGELKNVHVSDGRLTIGSTVTLSQLERAVETLIPELHRILRLFGSPQIRNAGTVAGNVANGSPIADLLPFLFVAGAEIELASVRGRRTVNINAFYRGYKTLDIAPDELIARISVPIPKTDETLRLFKVSKRRDLDISAFTAAFLMKVDGRRMSEVRVAFGGVAATVIRMPELEAFLEGKDLDAGTFRAAGEIARNAIKPITDVRGSAVYRSTLAENILLKLYFNLVA
jgi:xanthine dehydrogenase small subunit